MEKLNVFFFVCHLSIKLGKNTQEKETNEKSQNPFYGLLRGTSQKQKNQKSFPFSFFFEVFLLSSSLLIRSVQIG